MKRVEMKRGELQKIQGSLRNLKFLAKRNQGRPYVQNKVAASKHDEESEEQAQQANGIPIPFMLVQVDRNSISQNEQPQFTYVLSKDSSKICLDFCRKNFGMVDEQVIIED